MSLPTVAVLRAAFNERVTSALEEGALAVLAGRARVHGGGPVTVAGAWELVPAAARLARSGDPPDGILALGAIVQGETDHHDHLASAVFGGLARLMADTAVPIGLGVLTAPDVAAAKARAGGAKGNKGAEAAIALLGLVEDR